MISEEQGEVTNLLQYVIYKILIRLLLPLLKLLMQETKVNDKSDSNIMNNKFRGGFHSILYDLYIYDESLTRSDYCVPIWS